MKNIILSICIPTYNRSFVLEKAIKSIVEQPEFNDAVELIISDNCSTDNTSSVVKMYQEKYANIKFFQNVANLGSEKNIMNVLKCAEGRFLKLANDYCIFNSGSLKQMLDIVAKYEAEHSVIFFSNNRFSLDDNTECSSFDEFIRKVSFSTTWILYFGIWKSEFDILIKGQFEEYNFPHLDLLLRNLDMGFRPIIFNKPIITNQSLSVQGGYNIFESFIKNYLTLLKQHVGKDLIKVDTFRKEKKKLLNNFVFPWYCRLVINESREYNFKIDSINNYLRIYFEPYDVYKFYLRVLLYKIKRFFVDSLKILIFRTKTL